jgi:hypothetical protein
VFCLLSSFLTKNLTLCCYTGRHAANINYLHFVNTTPTTVTPKQDLWTDGNTYWRWNSCSFRREWVLTPFAYQHTLATLVSTGGVFQCLDRFRNFHSWRVYRTPLTALPAKSWTNWRQVTSLLDLSFLYHSSFEWKSFSVQWQLFGSDER